MTDRPTVALFTSDLRVRDNPAPAAACRLSREVVPLFVLDDAILRGRFASPNRAAFLVEALADLRQSLRAPGGDLVLRRGDPVAEAVRVATEVGARQITTSADVTSYARAREHRLARVCADTGIDLATFPGVTVVPPGDLSPGSGDHYRVFTPYGGPGPRHLGGGSSGHRPRSGRRRAWWRPARRRAELWSTARPRPICCPVARAPVWPISTASYARWRGRANPTATISPPTTPPG